MSHTQSAQPCRLYGALGSPYSLKMRAVLRYRRIPHIWIGSAPAEQMAPLFAKVKAPVIPLLEFPGGEVMNDSTPLLFELERRHPERSIVPPQEAAAFVARLLEDMADEWGTKAMFLHRWRLPRDQQQMSRWLMFDARLGGGRAEIEAAAQAFRDRQVGRMALVGCTAGNAPVIDESLSRTVQLLDRMATDEGFLFGSRPSLADFAWYGQLSQLAVDPTPADQMREHAPYLMRWIANLDDASGLEGAWREGDELGPAAQGLLKFASELYLPFLAANAAAAQRGAAEFEVELLGRAYSQGVFRYQVRCLAELRAAFAALSLLAQAQLKALAPDLPRYLGAPASR